MVNNTEHYLAAFILLARIGDIGTTYLITPKMLLEANPLMRKYRWPFASLTLLLSLTPYWSMEAAIIILVVSLLVSTSNSARLWFVRTMGEKEYHHLLKEISLKADVKSTIALTFLPGFFMAVLGGAFMLFYPTESSGLAFYFAVGVLVYAFTLFVYVPSSFLRLRRTASVISAVSINTNSTVKKLKDSELQQHWPMASGGQ